MTHTDRHDAGSALSHFGLVLHFLVYMGVLCGFLYLSHRSFFGISGDTQHILNGYDYLKHFGDWFTFNNGDMSQGAGTRAWMGVYAFNPHMIIYHAFSTPEVQVVAVYGFLGAVLFPACVMLATAFGFSRSTGVAAAWIACITQIPYFPGITLYTISLFIPGIVQMTAYMAIAVACLRRLDAEAPWPRNAGLIGLYVVFVCVALFSNVPFFVGFVPFTALIHVVCLVMARSRREALLILTGPALVFAIVMATAAPLTFIDTVALSSRSMLRDYLGFPVQILQFTSMFFRAPFELLAGVVTVCFVMGVYMTMRTRDRQARVYLVAILIWVAFTAIYAAFYTTAESWPWLKPIYTEWAAVPFLCLFAGRGIVAAGACAMHAFRRTAERFGSFGHWLSGHAWRAAGAGVVCLLAARILLAVPNVEEHVNFQPPHGEKIGARIIDALRTPNGAPFRGYAATLGDIKDHSVRTEVQVWLNLFLVPTFDEYTHYVSAFSNLFVYGAMFDGATGLPSVKVQAVAATAAQFRALGIARVITRAELVDGGFKFMDTHDGWRLYEVPGANTGDFTPTRVVAVDSARDGFSRLRQPAWDPRRTVYVRGGGTYDDLVPAARAKLWLNGEGFRVSAETPGRSMVLIPMRYSRCLEWKADPGTSPAPPEIIQANSFQVGLVFRGALTGQLTYRLGGWGARDCSRKDIDAARAVLREMETDPRFRALRGKGIN